jgi:hypothetical protein
MYVCMYVRTYVSTYVYMCVISFCYRNTHYVEPPNTQAVYRLKDMVVT